MLCLILVPSAVLAQSDKKPRKKIREIVQTVDSLRLQLRQSADRGVMLQWGDSLLAAKYNKKAFDTAYISRPDARWTVKMRGNLSGAFLQTLSEEEGVKHETRLMSDFRGTLSVAVAYRGVGIGLAVNPAKWAGKSQDYEFNLNSYSNRYGFDGSKTRVSSDAEHPFLRPITIRLNEFAIGGGYAYNLVAGKHCFSVSGFDTQHTRNNNTQEI